MSEEFYRIRRLPPYVFAEVNAMKAAARAAGEIVKDLELEQEKSRQAELALQAAFPADLAEGEPDGPEEFDVISARY